MVRETPNNARNYRININTFIFDFRNYAGNTLFDFRVYKRITKKKVNIIGFAMKKDMFQLEGERSDRIAIYCIWNMRLIFMFIASFIVFIIILKN